MRCFRCVLMSAPLEPWKTSLNTSTESIEQTFGRRNSRGRVRNKAGGYMQNMAAPEGEERGEERRAPKIVESPAGFPVVRKVLSEDRTAIALDRKRYGHPRSQGDSAVRY